MFSKNFAHGFSWCSKILVSCCLMLWGPWALAAITVNVKLTNYAGFQQLNNGPGMLVIMRSPDNDPNNRISIAWPTYNADQPSYLGVNAGTTAGYFWVVFNNADSMEANGCTSSPVNAATSTGYIANGGSFNVDIVCSGPPAAPTGLVATPGNGQMSIAFTAGSANGSPITNYQYSFNGGTSWQALSPVNAASPVGITGLTNGTTYSVTLRGVNIIGAGAASSAVVVTPRRTADEPTGVSVTPGNGQATVTFIAPASNGGAAITNYTATADPDGATGNCAGPAACTITVPGLINGTPYTFTVTADNASGTSNPSIASNPITPKADQAITFNNPGPQNYGAAPTLSATATSGMAPTFSSSTTGVCTITSGGLLNFVAGGTCTIAANQAGSSTFNAAPTVTQSFAVTATVPGAPTGVSATAGDTQASISFTAPGSNGGTAITAYTATANPGGATGISATSPITVAGLINGTAYTFTVTATNVMGTGSASAVSNSATPKAAQTITFANPGSKNFGTSPTLTATASSGLTPTFSSSTPGVCTITSSGTLTFVTAGTCTINADQAGNAGFSAAAQVTQSFSVNALVPGAPTVGTATAGDTQASVTFTAPASNGGSSITGYTVTASVGGATGTGSSSPIVVTGLANGTAYTFTVTATNFAGTGAASVASNAVTPKGTQVITFTTPGTQNFGTTPTLTAASTSALTVSFTSATSGVCTITTGGVLTFVTTGTCTINADQAGNGSFLAAAQVSRTFTVNAVAPGAPTIGAATAGDAQASVAFTAPAFTGGAAITGYSVTSNPGGVTGTGASSPIVVTGLMNGTAYTFTVTAANSMGTGSASAASNSVTPKAVQTITFANPGSRNFGTTPTLTATSDSGLPPTFTSSTTGVCTVTAGGALTFLTAGSCTINADQAGNGSYLAATQVSRTFAVNAVVPDAPTIGTASAGDTQATVLFTAPASNGGAAITGYTVTSTPNGITATGTASPIVVAGLNNGIAYTFTVRATNSAGPGSASAASNSVTPAAASVPNPFTQLPTVTPVPAISGIPGVVDMASGNGPAMGNCVADVVRQALGGTASYIGQNASGAMQLAWNGQIISLYPLAATTANAGATGIHNRSNNPLDVVSNCGTLTVAPAVYSLSQLGATLTGMGLTAQINPQGVITVLVNGTVFVVRPDFVVTPGVPGAPSLYVGADGLYRFTDSAGNTQIMRTAFLDTNALQNQIGLLGGSMQVQVDGTALLALAGGLTYILTPDLTLGSIPQAHAADFQWQDGPSHYVYRIQTPPYANYGQGATLVPRP